MAITKENTTTQSIAPQAVSLQTAFKFESVDFLESQVVAKEHTSKAYVTKKGVSKSARLIPARVTGTRFGVMTTKDYATRNPDMSAAEIKSVRQSDMINAGRSVSDELKQLCDAGSLGCVSLVRGVNGRIKVEFVPTSGGVLNASAALSFIQNNANHPAVIAYIESLKAAK